MCCATVRAQSQPPAGPVGEPVVTLPAVEVIGTTPLLGSGVDRAKLPSQTTVLTSGDISRSGIPNMLGSLEELAPGVSLSDTAGNPHQPALIYHGFQASPLQGNAQGLAVYLNGARFNQPFGDTVDWDLIPDIAIDRINLESSNPVFGLNALGGSLAVRLKNGFDYHGGEVTAFGGSFGSYGGQMQYGVQSGNIAAYTAARWSHEDGWRVPQSSDLANVFGTLGWRGNGGALNVDLIAADTRLNGPGTSPVEQIAADPSATFTGPALLTNKYARINVNGSYDISDRTSLQGLFYYNHLTQKYANGAVANFERCDNRDLRAFLCERESDVLLTGVNGNPIAAFAGRGPYSQLNLQSISTNGYGAALQVTNRAPLWGHDNQFIAGVSFDGARSLFAASAQAGGFDVGPSLWFGPGITIDQADGSLAPDRVGVSNAYYGAFFTDTFDLTPSLSVNFSGRFNLAQIDLSDKLGTALNGNHTYQRFNPAAGLTYKTLPGLSVYGSYTEANRAPMPVELTCSSPTSPCSLSNFLAADPDLKQVVSRTFETGIRAEMQPLPETKLTSELSLYRSMLSDDILAVGSGLPGLQFFRNVGGTLRQGIDLKFRLAWEERLTAYLAYSYIDAEFQTGFTEQNEDNPGADANGNIFIRPGGRIPTIPEHVMKFGADYKISDKWTFGGSALASSGRYLFGDEANLTPRTPPYFVLNLHSSYWVASNVQAFALINNAFNAQYYTFGTFGPTSAAPIAQAPGAANPRQYSLAAPIAVKLGVRVTF